MPVYRGDLALSENGLGAVLFNVNPAEAVKAFRRAIALQEKLVADSPSVVDYQSDLAASHGNLVGLEGHRSLSGGRKRVVPGHRGAGEVGVPMAHET